MEGEKAWGQCERISWPCGVDVCCFWEWTNCLLSTFSYFPPNDAKCERMRRWQWRFVICYLSIRPRRWSANVGGPFPFVIMLYAIWIWTNGDAYARHVATGTSLPSSRSIQPIVNALKCAKFKWKLRNPCDADSGTSGQHRRRRWYWYTYSHFDK